MKKTRTRTKRCKLAVVILAAGESSRLGQKKELLRFDSGESVIALSVKAFSFFEECEIYVAVHAGDEKLFREALSGINKDIHFVTGGKSRRESTLFALREIASSHTGAEFVAVHDGARPFVSRALIERTFECAIKNGGAVCAIDSVDTQKIVDSSGNITSHLKRDTVKNVQTPQCFKFLPFLAAHEAAEKEDFLCTDDSEIWAKYTGFPVRLVAGERENIKITYMEDWQKSREMGEYRAGSGWDIHALVAGRPLILGGVRVDFPKGEEAHSDGDVLLHALIDSLLGASGDENDIGTLFPPGEEKWRGASSMDLLAFVVERVRKRGFIVVNADCTIKIERPRLSPYKDEMRKAVARALGIDEGRLSIKAKSAEGLGEVGRSEAVEAWCTCLLKR